MSPEKRTWISVGGAVLVVVVVTAIIFVFGVIPLPKYPSLADQPDPSIPGTVAYLVSDEDSCLFTVLASGDVQREIWCGRSYVQDPVWTSDGLLALTDWSSEGAWVLIDVSTGVQVARIPFGDEPIPDLTGERHERADGAFVSTEQYGNGTTEVNVRLPDGSLHTVLSVTDAPRDYHFAQVQWSPDGAWILVTDSAGRLLVVGADGTPGARILAEGLDGWGTQAAWYIPGDDTYTIDVQP